MRYLLLLILSTVLLSAADTNPPPAMPGEVTLTSGRVLRNVTVVRWEKDRVVLKHAAGADPIPFSMFKSPSPGELPAMRSASEAAIAKANAEKEAKQIAADAAATQPVEYAGEWFLGLPGPDAYKLADKKVFVLPAEALKAFATPAMVYELPAPIAELTTDANGRFTFTLPANQKFVIFAQFLRKKYDNSDAYEWRISSEEITDPRNILLGNSNRRRGNCQYSFAGK